MKRPYLQLFTRDFLDCKELARCAPEERFVLIGLMCLAHEGDQYGFLCDSVGPLNEAYMASRCLVSLRLMRRSITALLKANRLAIDEDECLYVPRMVRDEEIRQKRGAGGVMGGNPGLKVGPKVNLPPNLPSQSKVNRALIYDSVSEPMVNLPLFNPDTAATILPSKANGWREESFERFWSVVWVKIGRGASERAWRTAVRERAEVDVIIAAAKEQGPRLLAEAREQQRGVLHPATWLNAKRWLDEAPNLAKPEQKTEYWKGWDEA